MKPLRTFRLEEYLGEWEFKARHHLTASDAQSMTVEELLALGTDAESEAARDGLMRLSLAYIETWGMPELREAVAGTYERVDADHVLAFAGAEEGLFWAMQELVGPGDHAVITVPCYQAMETVTAGDRRGRERAGAAPRGRVGAGPRRAARTAAAHHEARRRQLPEQPDGLRARRGDLLRARGDVRRARDPALLRRGLPRHRGRSDSGRSPRSPTFPRRPSHSTSPPSPTGCRVCASAGSPAATARCSSGSRSVSTTPASATPRRPSTSRRSRSGIARRSGSATGPSSPPTARSSTTSSPAGRTSSTGGRPTAAVSASRGTRAAT